MKHILFGACVVFLSISSFAQKVDLDRFSFDYSYLKLPKEYIDPAKRTFGVRVETSKSLGIVTDVNQIYDRIRVGGFDKVGQNPTVGVEVQFNSFKILGYEIKERVEEKKDKDGRVTERKVYYLAEVKYSSDGNYAIMGPRTPTQKQAEAQAKEMEKNRFLQQANVSNESFKVMSGSTGSFNQIYKTSEFKNSMDVRDYYRDNQVLIREEITREWVNRTISTINQQLSDLYGFDEAKGRDHLWILDSKSHPEYPIQQEAIKAVKQLMTEMSAFRNIKVLEKNLGPVMSYFEELKLKYKGSDKREQKMRYSAYYNLAKLYYLLDRPDDSEKEAIGLIQNGFDTSDGDMFVRQAKVLREDLNRQKMTMRHFE